MAYFCIMSAARLIPFALAAAIQCCDSEEDRAFMTSLYLNNSRRLFKPEFDGKESEPHVTTERETGVAWGFSEGREAKTC